jgi:NADH-quinone oxidoreductase subunit L
VKPLKKGEEDPIIAPLGPLHNFLRNKWYWDELYTKVFIEPVVFFSEVVVYEWIDQGVINGTLHLIARVVYRIGAMAKRTEELVFGDGVDWVKDQVLEVARASRSLQTGKIQEYAWLSMILAGALTVFILIFS